MLLSPKAMERFLPTQSYPITGYTMPTHPYDSTGAVLIGDFNGDHVPDVLAPPIGPQ